MSPAPVTVNRPPDWVNEPDPLPGKPAKVGDWAPSCSPVHSPPVQPPWKRRSPKAAVDTLPVVPRPSTACGDATNSPTCTVDPSPLTCAVPTLVQCVPSVEAQPVIVSPERSSRSQRTDAA